MNRRLIDWRLYFCALSGLVIFTFAASARAQSVPVITWAAPGAISHGTELSATQLNATANVAGTFSYVPAAGSVPAAGTDALSVTFTPTDTTDYKTAVATVSLVVNGSAPTISTVAGTGTAGISGNGGPATSAGLYAPFGVSFDSSGNYYIADRYNNEVRKVNITTGVITLVAGKGVDGYTGDGGSATSAELGGPAGLAFDASGNLYIADTVNNVIRKVTMATGIITTVVGTGTQGYSGDGGVASSAELNDPWGVAFDSAGNLYVADSGNNVIREINASTGIITTIAGNGTRGFTGDGGIATSAEMSFPVAILLDSAANLYISDELNSRIREVTASTGIITTIAGGGPVDYIGDGGPATSADIGWTEGFALDGEGNLYIADKNNGRIRKVLASTGIITTIAGNGVLAYSGDGGAATSAEIAYPGGVALDKYGNVFFADDGNNRIREINLKAVVTWVPPAPVNYGTALSSTQLDATANVAGTFAYTPAAGTIPVAGTDALSVMFTPTDMTDYDTAVATVSLQVNGPAPIITTVAGNGIAGVQGIGGLAVNAELFGLAGLAFDSAGNYYITNRYGKEVEKVDHSTGVITDVAGIPNGEVVYAGDGGPATSAEFCGPNGIAINSAGDLYIADSCNVIRKVTAATGIITTIAGNGTAGYTGDGGPATSAELSNPWGLAIDSAGNLYIADSENNVVRKINASSGTISTVAGNGIEGNTGDHGAATSAELSDPQYVALDSSGNLYLSERVGALVREVNASTGIITTVAGGGPVGYIGDGGPATSANLGWGAGIAVDASGNLYIGDQNNNRVRKVSVSTGIITTVAGNGVAGYSGDGGPATSAEIDNPGPIALDSHGNVLVGDSVNNRIREINYTAVVEWSTPAPVTYGTVLSSAQLNATANVPGTFVYTPAAGSVPATGNDTLSVTFTPTDTTDYTTATASVILTVAQATPVLNWPAPASISSSTPLSSTQLDATATAPGSSTALPGAFVYDPPAGTVLSAGDQTLSVTFTPTDSADYETVTETVPITVTASSGGGTGTGSTIYSYSIPATGGYAPNGNILNVTDSVMGTWTYTYDNLNRLTGSQGTEPGSDFTNYCWSYDNWGNREQQVGSASAITGGGYSLCEPENPQPLGYSTANRVNSGPTVPTYDAAGDVTNDGTHQYLYNADGNICAVSQTVQGLTTTTQYIYDADGNRVAKGITTSTGAVTSCDPSSNGFTASANYVQDEAGHQLSEFDGSGNWVHTNVYANNELIATYNGVGLHFRLNDWLGTLRVQTDDAGNMELSCQSLPFGDPNTQCVNASENFFTGKERDQESGNDYFGARYYASNMGRFMSPDWSEKEEPVPYVKLDNPQTLNLYSYVVNNPMRSNDPDGHGCTDPDLCRAITNAVSQGGSIQDGWNNYLSGQQQSTPASTVPLTLPPLSIPSLEGAGNLLGGLVDAVADVLSDVAVPLVFLANPTSTASEAQDTIHLSSGPKQSPNFIPPTNAPQNPPAEVPSGHDVRVMPPAPGYPNGYWVETNAHGQPIDPSTGKPPSNVTRPESRARTHVPLPPPATGSEE